MLGWGQWCSVVLVLVMGGASADGGGRGGRGGVGWGRVNGVGLCRGQGCWSGVRSVVLG